MKKINIYLKILFLTLAAVIFALAILPQEKIFVSTGWDKANHVLAFYVLFSSFMFIHKKMSLFIKTLVLIAFGIFIESIQYFLPYRTFSFDDILADCIGIALGFTSYPFYRFYYKKITENKK